MTLPYLLIIELLGIVNFHVSFFMPCIRVAENSLKAIVLLKPQEGIG
jgi:hypothetical protein